MASGRKQSNMSAFRAMNQSQPRLVEPELLDLKPITNHVLPEVRAGAFFKDPYEGRINALDELEKGNPLSEYGLKQMHHAFDLAEYSRVNPKTPAEKNLLNQSRGRLQDALAHNDFLRILREPDQDPVSSTFKYKGLDFPKTRGFDLMRREHETFRDKDRWLNFRELHEIKDDFRQSEKDSDLHPALQALKDAVDHPGGRPPIGYLVDAGNGKASSYDIPKHINDKLLHEQRSILERIDKGRRAKAEMNPYFEADEIYTPMDIDKLIDKEHKLALKIGNKYKLWNEKGLTGNKIPWKELPEVLDYIAKNTDSDEEFKNIVWGLFGTENGAPLTQLVDNENKGLPQQYHDSSYVRPKDRDKKSHEQFHHYLGGVTGDYRESHRYNNWLFSRLSEIPEWLKYHRYNEGDVRLFDAARKHRDDFVNKGRFTVGPNLRRLLQENLE